jgi:hypothetical protein
MGRSDNYWECVRGCGIFKPYELKNGKCSQCLGRVRGYR